MHFKQSIQLKITVLFLFLGSISLIISLFSFQNLNHFLNSFNTLVDNQNATDHSTQQGLLSLEEANSSVNDLLAIQNPNDIDRLRKDESAFSNASTRVEMFTNVLIFGSESQAFQKVNGGIVYSEWQRLGLDKTLIVAPLEPQLAQTATKIDLSFGSFSKDSLKLFALKRKTLRLAQATDAQSLAEKQAAVTESLLLTRRINETRSTIVQLTTKLIEDTNVISRSKISADQANAKSLMMLTIILGAVGFIINIIGGIFFIRIILVKPILDLSKSVKMVSDGDFSKRITTVSEDELGKLAANFNVMAAKLAEFYASLQQKVHSQTKVIEDSLEEANKTKKAMLNLLEDAKSLETQLKTEKEGVEKKVVERTKELHDEQIKLEASINSLSVGFILVDKNNNIVIINQTAKSNFCASETSPLATIKDCSLLHIEDELKGIIDIRDYINRCLTHKKTITINELAFQKKFLKIIITPIVAIGVIGAVILVEDITETKIMERSKDEFFSIASHELRTPLTAIRGNTSMIQQFYAEKIKDPELSEMIGDIHESSTRLIEIVNDFLDTSRLEMGKMEFKKESFDVVDLARNTIKEYLTTGSMKKLYLKIEDPTSPLPAVLADRNKVKQILINLIGNAIKFTEVGGISLKFEKADNFVKVFVSDTGKGISPASQNLLFRKFQQAQDNILTRDTTKGTGLGLYISKMIIQGMGGEVKIESSEIGKGTTFSFTMPIAPAANAAPQPHSDAPAPIANPQPLNTPDRTQIAHL